MTDAEFVQAFEACAIDRLEPFDHRAHVRLAWIYLRESPVPVVLAKLGEGLRRFARAHGAEGRYHETVTWAFALLIHERMARAGRERSFEQFIADHPELLDRQEPILLRYYQPATLESELARRCFVLPDRVLHAGC